MSGGFGALADGRRGELQTLVRLTELVTADYLEHYSLLPLELSAGTVRLGTWSADVDPQALDDFRIAFGAEPTLVSVPESDAREAILRLYSDEATTARDVIAGLSPDSSPGAEGEIPLDDLRHLANEAPVIKLVNLLVLEALDSRASDVHQPMAIGGSMCTSR